MKNQLTFTYLKEFVTNTGKIIKLKALITINGVQSVECIENDKRYPATELDYIID